MSGIRNGFSSGLQSFNNNIFVYTGRHCPTNCSEFKANLSRNMKTCAKACTAFLDSSLGMACAMGVLGIVAASVCVGEDLLDVVAATLLPMTTDSPPPKDYEKVLLCFKKQDHLYSQNQTSFTSLGTKNIGICWPDNVPKDSNEGVNCLKTSDYQKFFPNTSVPICQDTGSTDYDALVYMFWNQTVWVVSPLINCLSEMAFLVVSSTNGVDTDALNELSICSNDPDDVMVTLVAGEVGVKDNDVSCWNNDTTIQSKYKNYFVNTTTCINPVAPSNNYPESHDCNRMMMAFGAGSIAVLIVTLGKIIYNQCRAKGPKNSKKGRRLVALTLRDGLLLGASGLGSSVFVLSLVDSHNPASKEIIVASTALYWASATFRLINNYITSSIEEKSIYDEKVIVQIPLDKHVSTISPGYLNSSVKVELEEDEYLPMFAALTEQREEEEVQEEELPMLKECLEAFKDQ
ncbi:hypothetical protein [Candidatus Clavichlamydia salmonicola]|uniref:hypothetical protein n=1 Tax=Candidatus Clavichlamydia salmonicola TaxID=469812 RepID=UPI001891BCF3|nr:hypothetical protein [Candidatus Clavichlamydia salmonicola]